MDKHALVKSVLEKLEAERRTLAEAALNTYEAATHEESEAEDQYDTRGLEASYLARGQSKQATEVLQAIEQFEKLDARAFGKDDPIDLGALVELEGQGERSFYFIGPRAGGTEVAIQKKEVLVITPQSPLGEQLVGRKQGERLQMQIGATRNEFRVISVW